MRRSPLLYALRSTRWTLALLRFACPALAGLTTLSGVARRLAAYGIHWRRGRQAVTSPDPAYEAKMQARDEALAAARAGGQVTLFCDEVTLYRQPPAGPLWSPPGRGGKGQMRAQLSHASNTKLRVLATLDAVSGAVVFTTGSTIAVRKLVEFLAQVRSAYGPTVPITLCWDNWPNHHHKQVLAAAAEQQIELLFLPTYAPWTNPIEKLWRKLKQEMIYHHPWSDAWPEFKVQVHAWLASYATPSLELLRYTGLEVDPEPEALCG